MQWSGSGDGDDATDDPFDGADEPPVDLDEDALTDLDLALLTPDSRDPETGDLSPADFTDLDDQLLYFHREEDLRDRYGPIGLTVVTLIHFLPAVVGFLPGVLGVDTASLAPSLGLDMYFATGVVAFFSGVAAHLAREYGSRYLLRYALLALIAGSCLYVLTLFNATLAPDAYLTAGGIADGIFEQLNTGIIALSLIGGSLVVARLVYESVSWRRSR